ncbi:hypothetical protein KAH55_05860 [bacterium]|nr:hypothetical protein [bacterium]
MKIKTQFNFSVMLLLSAATTLRPCSTPVFRYALEYWSPDPYQLIIHCSDSVVLDENQWLKNIRPYSFTGDSTLNIAIKQRPALPGKLREVWGELYYPAETRIQSPLWQGEMSAQNAELLVESSLRKVLFQRLVQGQVAVWVLLPGPVTSENERAEKVLQSTIRRLSDSLTVPVTGYDTDGVPLARTDTTTYAVKVSFLKIDPADSTENLLRLMLRGIEPDLMDYGAPIAIPVFGRGRALYGLVGRGINRANITETCQSLLNWCSCQVKEENPGVDLLMQADWSQVCPVASHENVLPELIGFECFLPDTLSISDTAFSILPNTPIDPKSVFRDSVARKSICLPVENDSTAQIESFDIEAAAPAKKYPPLVRNVLLVFFLLILAVGSGSLLFKRRR